MAAEHTNIMKETPSYALTLDLLGYAITVTKVW